jgi:RNA polymerase sigma-70 factor (ECF subfamily)
MTRGAIDKRVAFTHFGERCKDEDEDTARLVVAFQAGDKETFAGLYSRYFDRVYGYMRVALADRHEAEDATQQAFTQVFEKLSAYRARPGKPFRAWLFTVVRNTALMILRKQGKLDVIDPAELDRYRDVEVSQEALDVLSWIADNDLALFVERLTVPQRQVLLLRYMLGLRAAEIAKLLDRTPNDVSQLNTRALNFLRARLAAIGRTGTSTSGPKSGQAPIQRRTLQAYVIRSRRYSLPENKHKR